MEEVEDVALPLYQGVMIWQFDPAISDYDKGANTKAQWIKRDSCSQQLPNSQYLSSWTTVKNTLPSSLEIKLGYRAVQNAANQRTLISTLIPGYPCGNSVATLQTSSLEKDLILLCFLCSLSIDWILRPKMSQGNVNWFYMEELTTPLFERITEKVKNTMIFYALALNAYLYASFRCWMQIASKYPDTKLRPISTLIALTPYERLRLRCILDAVVAELYGLDIGDFAWILKDCDHPLAHISTKAFARTLDPKGFWRVDKDKDPELRHTVLAQVAFQDLKTLGLEAFLALNNGEGWMLPDTLRLADYGLGHDERAKEPQPVGERIGEEVNREWASREDQEAPTRHSPLPTNHQYRYYPWQLAQPAADTWEECQRHADNLKRLLGSAPQSTDTVKVGSTSAEPNVQPPTDLFGNPLPTDLFGNVIEERIRKGKR